jgi:hypothetical protein
VDDETLIIGTDGTGETTPEGDAPVDGTTPEAGDAVEAPAAVEDPTPEEAGGEQLSIDAMVDSLRAPEDDAPVPDAPVAEEAPPGAEDVAEEAPSDGATDAAADADAAPAPDAAPEPAPLAAAEPVPAAEAFPRLARARLGARLPFWLYAGAWLVFAVGMAVALWTDAIAPFTSHPLYAWFVLGGAGLVALGPVIALVVWLVLRSGSDADERTGLVRALFLRASLAMLTGSVLWWAALIVLDLRRAGVLR